MAPEDDLAALAARIPGYDERALPIPAAEAFLASLARPIDGREQVALRSGLGRVLAEDLIADADVPAHDNAAMDGHAIRGSELSATSETIFELGATVLAGGTAPASVPARTAIRIMTGAVMPGGLDTVVPQELARVQAGRLIVPAGVVRAGDHRRLAGEDLARGRPALRAGTRLGPAELGLAASLGRAEVAVRRRLRVAFFSTGDELRSIGQPLDPGCVYDSNRHTLWAMLQRLGCEPIDLGLVQDDPARLRATFELAAREADAVITSGGVSVGEADHTKVVMREVGDVLFWTVAMRPGRPLAIGRLRGDGPLLFGLPGNPVAVMVTFLALVRPALQRMQGQPSRPAAIQRARAEHAIRKRPGRTEYQRAIVTPAAGGGEPTMRTTGSQGSGVLRSMSEATGLAVLPHEAGDVKPGDWVEVIPFEGLFSG